MSQTLQASELTWPREKTAGCPSSLVPVLTGGVVALDLALSVMSFLLAYALQVEGPFQSWSNGRFLPTVLGEGTRPLWNLLLFVPIVRLSAIWYAGLYQFRGEFPIARDLKKVLFAGSVGTVILVQLAFMVPRVFEFGDSALMRSVLFLDWLFMLYGLFAGHMLVRMVQVVARRMGKNIIPAVIVGDGDVAKMCLEEITGKPRLGYRLVGVLAGSNGSNPQEDPGLPIIGTINDLPRLIRQEGIREVLITDDRLRPRDLFETIMKCGHTHRVQYHVIPNLFNCLPQKTDVAQIGVLPMVKLFEEPISGLNLYLKRAIDLAASGLLILVTSPLWLMISILIKRESPGPVFYTQERVGMDGRIFLVYKFRSMRADTDDTAHREAVKEILNGGNNGSHDQPLFGKVKDDDRVTRVGAFIRRFSLDELPQLLNIFLGQMSLVGPRPLPIYQVEGTNDYQRGRHHIKPGLTGMWQVSGRNRLPFDEMIRLDIFYIENWSFWLDLKIILKTPAVMLFGETEN